ncbi:hypothetical protein PRIC1_010368 [Phytophthora ramorum]
MRSIVVYSDTNCKGTPIRVTLVGDEECTSDKAVCTSDGQSVGTQYTSSHCVDVDRHTYVAEIFSEFSFVTMEYYTDDGCDTFQGLNSFLAAGTCQHVGFGNDTSSSIVRLYSNGSAVLQLFEDTFCGIDANSTMHIDSSDITEHTCFGSSSGVKFFSSQSPTSSYSSPGLSVGPSQSGGIRPKKWRAPLTTSATTASSIPRTSRTQRSEAPWRRFTYPEARA